MTRWSTDSRINSLVKQKLQHGWKVRKGKKHDVLIAPNNRRIAIPSSPNDCKSFFSFNRYLKYLY